MISEVFFLPFIIHSQPSGKEERPVRHLTKLLLFIPCTTLATNQDCNYIITVDNRMQFDTKSMVISKECNTVTVTLENTGTTSAAIMGHNWVLARTEDINSVLNDGWRSGLENDFVKPNDDRVIAYTKVLGGGESETISISMKELSPTDSYSFVCSFPGHFANMTGTFEIK